MRRRFRRGYEHKINSSRKDVRRSKQRFKSMLNRDLAAMNKVWIMLKQGTIRALGEIGRQYY